MERLKDFERTYCGWKDRKTSTDSQSFSSPLSDETWAKGTAIPPDLPLEALVGHTMVNPMLGNPSPALPPSTASS